MKKPSKVVFIEDKLEISFNSLPSEDPIKKSIIRAIKDLKENAFSGIQMPKRLIPKSYKDKYGLNNLWKYDLPQGWRLLNYEASMAEMRAVNLGIPCIKKGS